MLSFKQLNMNDKLIKFFVCYCSVLSVNSCKYSKKKGYVELLWVFDDDDDDEYVLKFLSIFVY